MSLGIEKIFTQSEINLGKAVSDKLHKNEIVLLLLAKEDLNSQDKYQDWKNSSSCLKRWTGILLYNSEKQASLIDKIDTYLKKVNPEKGAKTFHPEDVNPKILRMVLAQKQAEQAPQNLKQNHPSGLEVTSKKEALIKMHIQKAEEYVERAKKTPANLRGKETMLYKEALKRYESALDLAAPKKKDGERDMSNPLSFGIATAHSSIINIINPEIEREKSKKRHDSSEEL